MPDVVTISDHRSGNLEFANRNPYTEMGFDPEETIAMTRQQRVELIHPDDQQALWDYHKRGEWIWLAVRGRVFRRDEAGNVIQTMHIGQDITAHKRAEEVLRTSEEKLRAIETESPRADGEGGMSSAAE